MPQTARESRFYPIAMLLVGLCLVTQATVELWLMRQDSWLAAAESGRNLHRTLREGLSDLINRRDVAMLDIAAAMERPGVAELSEETRRIVLFGRPTEIRQGNGTLVTDARGAVLASSVDLGPAPIFVDHRAYFAMHRTNPDLGLYIGAPIRERQTGNWAIPLSRRRSTSDGSFAGVVASMVSVERINALFANLELGEDGVIALLDRQGQLLAHMPPVPPGSWSERLGQEVLARIERHRGQQFVDRSIIDGARSFYTPGAVPDLPLTLLIARDTAAIEADWHLRAALVIAAILGALVLLFIATSRVGAEMRSRRSSEAALAASEARYRAILQHASDTIVLLDPIGRSLYVSHASMRLLGAVPEMLLGRGLIRRVLPSDRARVLAGLRRLRQGAPEVNQRFRARHMDGRVIWVEAVMVLSADGAVVVVRDVTAQQAGEAALARLAYQDPLTGIANRRGFDNALANAWREGRARRQPVGLLLLDLDHFKQLNDQHGHPAGDAALRLVASKLRGALRHDTDLAARLGGDELALLLPGIDRAGALRIGERVRRALASRARSGDTAESVAPISVSIGAASLVPGEGAPDSALLLAAADAALYRAKDAGRNRVAA